MRFRPGDDGGASVRSVNKGVPLDLAYNMTSADHPPS